MSERAAFISAILDNLADDTSRLVFADWLQENGEEARAEFIRVQIEAAKRPVAELYPDHPGVRAAELLVKHEAEWRKAVGEKLGVYRRGFLTGVPFYTTNFARADSLLALEPLAGTLHLWGSHPDDTGTPVAPEDVDRLAANPLLRAVTKIDESDYRFGPERFVRLMKSSFLVNLHEIVLFEEPIGLVGVKAVAESPSAFVLESLELNESLQRDTGQELPSTREAVKLIATSPRFAALKHLGLMFNSLGDQSIEALLASKTLPRNLNLELENNDFDEERFAEALAERFSGGSDVGEE